jgi:hypothetical protein
VAATDTYGEALVKAMQRRTYTLEVTAHGVNRARASAMTPKRLQAIIDGEPPVECEAARGTASR